MRANGIYIIFLLQIYVTIRIVFGFNVSPVPNIEFKYPETETKESTYFGYSLVLRENSVIIGAPRANVSTHGSVKSPGAVFQCSLLTTTRNKGCTRLAVDERNSSYNKKIVLQKHPFWNESSYYIKSVNRNNSYLGATMDGGPGEKDPLMICAPGFGACNEGFDGMQGICYWTPNFNSADFIKNRFVMNDYRNQRMDGANFNNDLAQMGFSLEVINNHTAIMGAPGFDQWRGASVLFNDKLQISKMINKGFGYIGYAVSAGHLNGSNLEEVMFVSSAPHGSSYKNKEVSGLVYIFDKNRALKYLLESETEDFGEFFGYAVQVEDVDDDRWDDILVGAPFHVGVHSNCTDCSDVGVVYLFKNTAKDNYFGGLSFEKHVIKSPFGSDARFGSSIAKLGDINLDGYNDIAIGAPFAYGTGAVAIYFGSENGLKTDPSAIQILKPTDHYQKSMFGFTISRGVDTDRNGYNDLAIGAPLSESVFYYRAYPVVELVATINTTKVLIPLDSKELKIIICYKFKTKSTNVRRVNIFLDITLDKQYRRFSFLPLNSATLRLTKFSTTNNQCDTLIAQNNGTQVREIFQEIPMNVKISLVNDAKNAGKKFCVNCVATTSEISLQQMNTSHIVYYDHKCNGSCRSVDLSIRHAIVPEDITFGLNKTITVYYEIMNKGGRAYQPQLIIDTSPRLNFKKSQLCSPFGSAVTCDLLKFENETSEILIVKSTYEVSELIDCDEILITANVGSITLDEYPEDNSVKSRIRVHRHSVLELLGKPEVNTIELNDTNVIYDLQYKLEFSNLGPSKLKNANLAIMMPYQFNGNSFIQLNETNIEIDHQIIDFIPITQDLFQHQNQTDEHFLTERNSLISEYKLNPEGLKIWDCYSINGINCIQSHILFGVINPGDHKIINLNIRLSSKDIKKSNTETWLLKLNASFTVAKRNYSDIFTKIKLQPIIIHNYQRPKLPLWIWIISGVIGFFLLSIVTWYLVRRGFFKRQTKEEMEKRLVKQMEQEYMNAEIQRNIRESFRKDATDNINQEELEFLDSSFQFISK